MMCWCGYLSGARCLYMVQLMPQHTKTIVSCIVHIQTGFNLFWHRLTQVVLEKRPLNGCIIIIIVVVGGSVAEWLACWTQARKGPGSNRSRDAVG